ncbi:argonaute/piwi family protein [Microbacterium rhizosphaerae]|uniref:Piwi domain-containing protein n=1 Tax=Microbacterium rhizosphaerae TaxID=1678237 RepID=A0ABZ0SN54_9MICO|nr:hypothetical protein [Microbacterium rhizosphaerae]WPR89706.1 hypothetical protein SM116_18410 [Microbacterium rhizosphaerae]
MRLALIDEPDLEFANGSRHTDPRHGISFYGPADLNSSGPRTIRVGIIGPKDAIEGVKKWLDKSRSPIAAKRSHLTGLFMAFPGFDTNTGFRSTIVWDSRLERTIPASALRRLDGLNPLAAIQAAVDLYDAELTALNEEPSCDVVIVCRPDDLPEQVMTNGNPDKPWEDPKLEAVGANFRALLKARSLKTSRPIQIIRRDTWDPSFKPKDRDERRGQQDEATKAWNLHTALYYKAGGMPWRMTRTAQDLTSCYIGVAFYRTTDGETLQTSVAQVFNQRGDGVIVRGAPAKQSKEDRQPHLTEADAKDLLVQSLARYRSEHRTMPARVMLHKASSFTTAETSGFRAAADAERIDLLELVWLPHHDSVRLFRPGEHPPLRGTLLSLTEDRHVLYTRGSVPLYRTYPGMYVPTTLPFRPVDVESSAEEIAAELLMLTKMNWNATQLDGRLPITLRTADSIGDILKHLPDGENPAPRYAYYM